MALPDLVDQPTLRGHLAALALSGAQLAELPGLAAAASASVRRFCSRDFTAGSYDELYTLAPNENTVTLRQFPVIDVARVTTNPTAVLTVLQGDVTTNQRATCGLTPDGTGLTLIRLASGVSIPATVPFSANPTLASLAAAVGALGAGWSATPASGYGLFPSADFRAPQGQRAAMGPRGPAPLYQFADDCDYVLRERTGRLALTAPSASTTDSPRWGPAWQELDDAGGGFGGYEGLRVVYTAGFLTVPADVALAAAECVKVALERFRTDGTLMSESDGVLTWAAREDFLPVPHGVMVGLSSYVNHRG